MAKANEAALGLARQLRRQAVRVGILSNPPYPIAKALPAPVGASSTSSPSRVTTASVSHREASTGNVLVRLWRARRRRVRDDRRENVRAAEFTRVSEASPGEGAGTPKRLKELGFLF